jgi:hypothetical protein
MRYAHSASGNNFIAHIGVNSRHAASIVPTGKTDLAPCEAQKTYSFSQLNRSSAMQRNLTDAISFMNDQELTLDQLIEQLRYFLNSVRQCTCQEELYCEYLLHADAIKSSLNTTHRGKPLFDNFYNKPLRMHIELNGIVTPIDLPNPQLKSSPAIQGFVSGTGSRRVPSRKLISECLATLLDSILQVRSKKEKTENLLADFQIKHFKRNSSKQLNFIPHKHRTPFWFSDFCNYLHGQWSGIINSLKVKPV